MLIRKSTRRTFMKSTAAATAVAIASPRATLADGLSVTPPLSQFGYADVRLL